MVNRRPTAPRHAPTLLSSAQVEELRQAVSGPAPYGERWTSRTVAEWMAEHLGRPVGKQRGWDYLQRLKARRRHPRPRQVAARAEDQDAFHKGSAD
jgi:transposase